MGSGFLTVIVILAIIAIVVTTLPFWKWIYGIYKEKKEAYNRRKEEAKKEQAEMKANIKYISEQLVQLPELDKQVRLLTDEVSSIKSMNSEISKLQDSMDRTNEQINEIKTTVDKVNSDIGIIFDNDNDEFRIYLTQLQFKHIENNEPMTREIRQELRIKFDNYDKRGGNGWAKDLYLELMSIPVTPPSYNQSTKE